MGKKSRFSKWFGRQVERFLGRYNEGPEPPPRFGIFVDQFRLDNPKATVDEWADFALRLAGETYRSGWQRGYEYVERTDLAKPEMSPEAFMDAHDPTWREPYRAIHMREAGHVEVPMSDKEREERRIRKMTHDYLLADSRERFDDE